MLRRYHAFMSGKDSPEQFSGIKVPPTALTTPCTLQALHNWLLGAHVVAPGAGSTGNVTSTTTTINVA